MNCFSGIEIGVFGGTDGLGVDWLSDDDCLKSIEGKFVTIGCLNALFKQAVRPSHLVTATAI